MLECKNDSKNVRMKASKQSIKKAIKESRQSVNKVSK
jgi:hypothetical protein